MHINKYKYMGIGVVYYIRIIQFIIFYDRYDKLNLYYMKSTRNPEAEKNLN